MTLDPTDAGTPAFALSLRVAVASITALREGAVPPETIWTPDVACDWVLRLGRRPITAAELMAGGAGPASAGVAVCEIRHRSDRLTRSLEHLAARSLRLMVWTLDEIVPWSAPSGTQWHRLTADDLVHLRSHRAGDVWVSCLVSPYPSLTVEVVEPPLGFGDRGAAAVEAPQLPLQGQRGGGVAPDEA